jgi:hypothetical protein
MSAVDDDRRQRLKNEDDMPVVSDVLHVAVYYSIALTHSHLDMKPESPYF